MRHFSDHSQTNLDTCDPILGAVFTDVLALIDHSVIEGYRLEARQAELFANGKTKVEFPHSKHNRLPSMAVDAVPYPIDWDDVERMCFFAGLVIATGIKHGVDIRWGGDWDRDGQRKDNNFDDLAHFELVGRC